MRFLLSTLVLVSLAVANVDGRPPQAPTVPQSTCVCGDDCKCAPGKCPSQCPVMPVGFTDVFDDWRNGPTAAPQGPAVPPCQCGCDVTGKCTCKSCNEHTADPAWKKAAPQAPILRWGDGPTPGHWYGTTLMADPNCPSTCGPLVARTSAAAGCTQCASAATAASAASASPRTGPVRRLLGKIFSRRGVRGGGCCGG